MKSIRSGLVSRIACVIQVISRLFEARNEFSKAQDNLRAILAEAVNGGKPSAETGDEANSLGLTPRGENGAE